MYKIFFNLKNQYFAKFAASRKKELKILFNWRLCPEIIVWFFFVQLRNKRHKIAVDSVVILADLLLDLAGSHCLLHKVQYVS